MAQRKSVSIPFEKDFKIAAESMIVIIKINKN
jgi:hypothetical protein